ncbi:MAG: hypothetical protein J1E61_04185 [Lachnospiraceae bacterium]|nr:hypothetical protein [Lachnospiraceae bacterium]
MGYFKGWYFKCCSKDKTIAFIPAYHRVGHKVTASLQIITDDEVFHIPFLSLQYQEKPLSVRIGDCFFGQKGIRLNIRKKGLCIKGMLRFSHFSPIQYDIMGWFRFIPFMQCRHSVYSMEHDIEGWVEINGIKYVFQNGKGYLEGDRGRSFPKEYIWTQSFFENGSLMLSVADIPLLGFHFTGIIGVVLLKGREYRIATYRGASVKQIGKNIVTVKQGDCELTAELMEKNAHPLHAPVGGRMSRIIHESPSCKARYLFSDRGVLLCDFISDRAGFEFEYNS